MKTLDMLRSRHCAVDPGRPNSTISADSAPILIVFRSQRAAHEKEDDDRWSARHGMFHINEKERRGGA